MDNTEDLVIISALLLYIHHLRERFVQCYKRQKMNTIENGSVVQLNIYKVILSGSL